jgi:transposase
MDSIPDIAALDESAQTTSRKSARSPWMEIIARGERRRRWILEQKREIVAESYGPELTPREVARKHRISSGQLYMWRHELLGLQAPVVSRAMPRFAEVALTAPLPPASPTPASTPQVSRAVSHIEIVLPGNIIVRVDAAADGGALSRVLDMLRRRSFHWPQVFASIWPGG